MDYNKIDFHKFVDEQLAATGHRMVLITEELMNKRLDEFMSFVNGILSEYADEYDWHTESKEYFLNGLVDKWKYSFVILNQKNEICFVSFSSVYEDHLHLHFCYAAKGSRGLNFSKYCMIKLCQSGIDNGFVYMDAYWPKQNSGSIILFLKLGWRIESMRDNQQVFMTVDLERSRNITYDLIVSEN